MGCLPGSADVTYQVAASPALIGQWDFRFMSPPWLWFASISSFGDREYPELALAAVPMEPAPGAPGAVKLSSEGNWKGSVTGTKPPNIPKLSGRAAGLPRRALLADDTCERCDVAEGVVDRVPDDTARPPPPALDPWPAPPAVALCLCP